MVDTKGSALTEVTELTDDDGLYVIDDMDGTPSSKRITAANAAGYFGLGANIDGDNGTALSNVDDYQAIGFMSAPGISTSQTADWDTVRLTLVHVFGGWTPTKVAAYCGSASDGTTSSNVVLYNRAASGLAGTIACRWTFNLNTTGKIELTGQSQALPESGWYWFGEHHVQLASESKPAFYKYTQDSTAAVSMDGTNDRGLVYPSQPTLDVDLTSQAASVSQYAYSPMVGFAR